MPKNWVNPKKQTYRQNMDRRLESAGLLNYQTKGLSQEEIARRYAAAGISINGNSQWYKQNYGVDAPQVLTDRQQFNNYRKQLISEQPTPNIFPRLDVQGQPTQQGGFTFRAGGGAKGIDPKSKAVFTTQTPVKSITTAAPKPTNATSPYAPMVFAKPEQVQNGEAGWVDLSATDRSSILRDPQFYKTNQITKYAPAIQQQILADPHFDWKQLPGWQRVYYSMSSNPVAMGVAQGLAMSAGNPGGALICGVLGGSASVVGYDPNKEFWQQGNADGKLQKEEFARGAFGLLNWGAEFVEKGVGVLVKSASILTGNDPNFDPNKRNLDIRFNENFSLIPGKNFDPNLITGSTWDAGAGTFEAIAPSFMQMASQNPASQVSPLVAVYDLFTNPEKYKGTEYYLGAANAEQLQTTFYERLQQAEDRIKAGEDYRTVATEMQTGIVAQVGDMAGQGIADPLNHVGLAETVVGKAVSDITGDKVAAEAFRQSMTGENPGYYDAKSRAKNIINTPGEAIKIDPNYKVQELGSVSKWMAGL